MRTYDRRGVLAAGAALALSASRAGSALAARPAASRTLHYYNWIDYVSPETYSAFTKATGIAVRKSYYASNEALLARLRAGRAATTSPLRPGTWWRRSRRKGSCTGSTGSSCATSERPSTRGSSAFHTTPTTVGPCQRTGAPRASCTAPTRSGSDPSRGPSSSRFERYPRKLTLLDGATEVIGSVAVMLGYSFNTESERGSSACGVPAVVAAVRALVRLAPVLGRHRLGQGVRRHGLER